MTAAALRQYDVCNGDADGLCAVRMWRLHAPAPAVLVTGLKREIDLLDRVPSGAADEILVCDISLRRNRAALERLLAAGAAVRYFDHHAAGEVPVHPRLETHLDFASDVCTSVLVDRWLGGRFRAWAAVGAYGDGLTRVGDRLAADHDAADRVLLRMLGEAINYNAYGETAADVLIHPAALYTVLARHDDPLALVRHEPIVGQLDRLRRADLDTAQGVAPVHADARGSVRVLPDAPWSRRVIGTLANELARTRPDEAQAVLKLTADGAYVVSVRAPRSAPGGAHDLCAAFGGGGRAAAAGIDALPGAALADFVAAFAACPWGRVQEARAC